MTSTLRTGRRPERSASSASLNGLQRRALAGNKAYLFIIIATIYMKFASSVFLTTANVTNIFDQNAALFIIAAVMALVLGAGQIDLSIAGIIPLVGIVIGKLLTETHLPMVIVMLIGISVGLSCGLVNGLVVTKLNLPSFIVTLATSALFLGIEYIISNYVSISYLPNSFDNFGEGRWIGIPHSILIAVPVILAIYIMNRYTVFGRHVVGVGANAEAMRVAGVNVNGVKIKVFLLSGAACAIASIILTAQSASADTAAGSNLTLLVIAAAVIGGTSLFGGKADVIGAALGGLAIGIINNGLVLLGVNQAAQVISQGVLILLVLAIDVLSAKFLARVSQRNALRE